MVYMEPYLDKIFKYFPEEVGCSTPSPHTNNLFKVRDESETKFLPEEQAVMFHHTEWPNFFLCPGKPA